MSLRTWVLIAAFAVLCGTAAAQQPQVAFTFDDLPAHGPLPPGETRPEPVKSILATLKAEHMPPVYGFVNGFRLIGYPYQIEILKDWHNAGEPLGSHTYSHLSLDVISAERFEQDIAANEAVLAKVDPDGDWHWFRYPFLDEGDTLAKRRNVRAYLKQNGYKIAEVTIDFQDYLWNEPYARCMAKHDDASVAYLQTSYLATASEFIDVFRGLSKQLYGRDIPYVLLMHVGAFDARMLPRLIALFRAKGFQFVTLQQAESDPAYSFDPNIGYPGGGTLMELVAQVKKVNFPDNTEPDKKLDAVCR
ncbi:polysaccharide deacetylase family protein [Granulicella sp. 5B5]|nr:polysaccharide deacetylase family protein [Granulicella sp. 5B5]